MYTVTIQNIQDMQHAVETPNHKFIADEANVSPSSLGPSPFELLLAALGT